MPRIASTWINWRLDLLIVACRKVSKSRDGCECFERYPKWVGVVSFHFQLELNPVAVLSIHTGNNLKYSEMTTWCNNIIYWSFFSSKCFGRIRPSSGALDVKLQHMVFCTRFVDGWWSWEPLRRSCGRFGTFQTGHTIYAAALKTTTHLQTGCRKPYAAT